MKILRINDIYAEVRGGMWNYITEVNAQLRNRGHEISCMFRGHIKGPANVRLRRYIAPYCLPKSLNLLGCKEQPDVVEIHEPLGAWYVRERKRNSLLPPVVISVYGLEARAFEARIATDKWLGKPTGFFSKLGAKSIVWQSNYSLKYADHVVVETNEDKEWIVENLKRNPESITIQTGGVNTVFFGNEQKHNADIIFLGSWIERKGITVFSQVVNKLIEEGLGSKITIAGTGSSADEVIAYFTEKAKKFISVIPKLNSEAETADLLSKSGIFFFPSNFEGVPLSLLEAAASGCAILTTNICGMKDFISDGINGFLCNSLDEKHFYNRLEYLVKNHHIRTKFGSEARCSAKKYTWDRSAEQFLSACISASKGKRKYINR